MHVNWEKEDNGQCWRLYELDLSDDGHIYGEGVYIAWAENIAGARLRIIVGDGSIPVGLRSAAAQLARQPYDRKRIKASWAHLSKNRRAIAECLRLDVPCSKKARGLRGRINAPWDIPTDMPPLQPDWQHAPGCTPLELLTLDLRTPDIAGTTGVSILWRRTGSGRSLTT